LFHSSRPSGAVPSGADAGVDTLAGAGVQVDLGARVAQLSARIDALADKIDAL
jgi:hypothetical protein